MLAIAHSATLVGIEGHPVRIEVDATRGVPTFELVGLAEATVRESRVRVKSALSQLGIDLSDLHVTVSLAPADLKKNGSGLDVGIAAAALAAVGAVPVESVRTALFLGELSLAGRVHGIRGVLPHLLSAKSRGFTRAIVPRSNQAEARLVRGIDCRTCETLDELAQALRGEIELPRCAEAGAPRALPDDPDDFADVRGQDAAKRALLIAAAGGHNVLFIGPPGAGKTMLARRLPGILPDLSHEEALEVMAIHSVAGLLPSDARELPRRRPFRSPHHTISDVALVGGGDTPRPGEVSLAHRGVLFLDELGEYRRGALEALRQPLEDGVVTISRAHSKATFNARAMVIAATNPCPCGYLGSLHVPCRCSQDRVRTYRARLSGPLLDRLDLHVVLAPVEVNALSRERTRDSSAGIRQEVLRAREIQANRLRRRETRQATNATLSQRDTERICILPEEGKVLLAKTVEKLGLSARAYSKVLRVARTIADLEGGKPIEVVHVAEAIQYRALDKERAEARPAA